MLAQVVEALTELYAPEQQAILALYDARTHDHRDHLSILAVIEA